MSENKEEFWKSWGDFLGYNIGGLGNFTKKRKIELINNLELSRIHEFDPIELQIIIGKGNLPKEFESLIFSEASSDERLRTLEELKEIYSTQDDDNMIDDDDVFEEVNNGDLEQIDDVDNEITNENDVDKSLPVIGNDFDIMRALDNELYSTIDEEAMSSLIHYRLRILWNKVLNGDITIDDVKSQTGGKYFNMIIDMFLTEYNIISNYIPPVGYSFQYKPNLMQKLTVHRLLMNKQYGNWSGTGAGKTNSFIISSREINSKLTLVVALNSTINQLSNTIKSVYPDSVIYTKYNLNQVFDRTKHNYLILNYEKFQLENSEELYQNLTNNNIIDFVVIDEVHNVKQRNEENESIRRGVLLRLMGRIRENNSELYTLVMSATPVINNIFEAKSLLTLLTGDDYDDIKERRTLGNGINMFIQLSINGLRFIPKYNITLNELTGHNMSNLNINGEHLMDLLLSDTNNFIDVEKILLPEKLKSISNYINKGTLIYSYFTTGFIKEIKNHVNNLGFSVGVYTGDEELDYRNNVLKDFINGKIDVLIGSKPIGTGVDGLQDICDKLIILTLPWTDAEYKQLIGRVYRQGSVFDSVDIIIPQVKISLDDDEVWSWDVQRLNLIKNKRTLADLVVDGIIPSKTLPSPETMYKKAIDALSNWKNRVNQGDIITNNRNKFNIELYPEIDNEQEKINRINSELSEYNRKGKLYSSTKMNKEFNDNPDSWFRYHQLRNQRMDKWEEIPYEYIATKIKHNTDIIADFGCGTNEFKNKLPNNKVYSFDHIAIDDSVYACDMKDVSKYLNDESVDITVFSLSLWGSNYTDYLNEAFRILKYKGIIYIAEPTKYYETEDDYITFIDILKNIGFTIIGNYENRGKFSYFSAIKI